MPYVSQTAWSLYMAPEAGTITATQTAEEMRHMFLIFSLWHMYAGEAT
jgi:hypothetical protein